MCLPIFGNITEIVKKLRVYVFWRDATTKLQMFVYGSLITKTYSTYNESEAQVQIIVALTVIY